MNNPSKSLERHTFQRESYVKRQEEKGEPVNKDYLQMFDNILEKEAQKWDDPASRVNNLEYDLVTTDWILAKARENDAYAQNIYAALCNNGFIKLDVIPVLKGEEWGCSWRYAGGIVADMQQKGDYIDWYCSGIKADWSDEDFRNASKEEQERYIWMKNNFVSEGTVTEEIKQDLFNIGWLVIEESQNSIT